jgi:hypothetical protein
MVMQVELTTSLIEGCIPSRGHLQPGSKPKQNSIISNKNRIIFYQKFPSEAAEIIPLSGK